MSGTGTEIELKLRVDDQAALDRVARAARAASVRTVVQVNRFFDTADRALDKARLVLRLRDEGGAFFLTAKGSGGSPPGATLKTNLEEEIAIDAATAAAIRAGTRSPVDVLPSSALVSSVREAIAGRPLVDLGAFTNRRTRVTTTLDVGGAPLPVVLELDATTFPGDVVHHEVEVELAPDVDAVGAERALRDLLARAGVEGRPAPGKARRFFAALRGEPI